MSQYAYTTRALGEAEQLIAAGDLPRALGKLQTAAQNVPPDHADAAVLFAQIQDALGAVDGADPHYRPEAQAVRDFIVTRGVRLESLPTPPHTTSVPAAAWSEPWFYGAAEVVAKFAIVASIICVIGGILVGVHLSAYTSDGYSTAHHGNVLVFFIAVGVFAAAGWLAVAAGLNLLVEIGRSLRSSRSRS